MLPGNEKTGTLDSMLVNCATIRYPRYKTRAEQFLDEILQPIDGMYAKELKELRKPFGKEKALVATIVSVLKPGRANAPSIADDEWICELTEKQVPEVARLKQFLVDLLELS